MIGKIVVYVEGNILIEDIIEDLGVIEYDVLDKFFLEYVVLVERMNEIFY